MASDETRRLLKLFGVAVTNFEDAIECGATPVEIAQAEAEARQRFQEIAALFDKLRVIKPAREAVTSR